MQLLRFIAFIAICSMPFQMLSADQNGERQEPTIKMQDSNLGKILTDSKGMTVYTFTQDKQGEGSSCYEQCAVTWPPVIISEGKTPIIDSSVEHNFSVIVRHDGKRQVTYDGRPLYYYVKDKKPGDTFGQNVEGKWFVIKPSNDKNREL